MKDTTEAVDAPVPSVVISWLVIIPLLFFASFGYISFFGASCNNAISQTYGALVAQTSESSAAALAVRGITLLAGSIILQKLKAVIGASIKDKVFICLAGLALISSLWSQSPANSLHWAAILAMNTFFVFFLYKRFGSQQQIELFFLLGLICVVSSVSVSLLFPKYGIDQGVNSGAWCGIYSQKNICAMATVYMLPAAFYLNKRSLLSLTLRTIYVGMSILLVSMTHSQTSMIVLILMGILFVSLKIIVRFRTQERHGVFFVGLLTALGFVAVAFSMLGRIAYSLGKNPSLTGRTQIWQAVAGSIAKHPLIGYGYRSFWLGYKGESANVNLAANWAVTSSHNAYLEVWLTLGAVGLMLLVYAILRSVRDCILCLGSIRVPYVQWCICLIFVTIAFSVDEAELLAPNNLAWMMFMLACVGVSGWSRRERCYEGAID